MDQMNPVFPSLPDAKRWSSRWFLRTIGASLKLVKNELRYRRLRAAINVLSVLLASCFVVLLWSVIGWFTLLMLPLVLIVAVALSSAMGTLAITALASFDQKARNELNKEFTAFGSS